MHLQELYRGDKIIYHVTIQEKEFQFPAHIIQNQQNCIVASPITIGEKVIGLNGVGVHVEIIYMGKSYMPIVWEGIVCKTVLYKGEKVYLLEETQEGKEQNRRSDFRLKVQTQCVIQLYHELNMIVAQLHDVSKTGFSFITDTKIAPNNESKIIKMRVTDLGVNLIIGGMIVRCKQREDGKYVYGCQVIENTMEFQEYMANKQRIMIEKMQNL